MPTPVDPLAPSPWGPVARPPAGGRNPARAVAREFEALLIQQLVTGLRRTVEDAEPPSQAMTLWRELLDVHIARAVAAGGGIGLAHLVEVALSRDVGVGTPPAADPGPVPPGGHR
jgi:Rod binding domain-containing protein